MSRFSNSSTLLDPSPTPQPSFGIVSNLLPVHLILLWGEGRAVSLFLRDTQSASGELETLGARLNDPDSRFVPVSVHGVVELVRSGSLCCVEVPGELPEVARMVENGARLEPVAIELMTGEVIRGDLLAYAAPGRTRLSDILNQPEPFFLVVCPDRAVYVNRDAVATVRAATRPASLVEVR